MEKQIKIITLGPQAVGKTSIIERIIHNKFEDYYQSTISLEFNNKTIKYKNSELKLMYVDTAGQEINNSLTLSYIRNSHIVLLVYDNLENFEELKKRWFHYYKENANKKNPKFLVIANKSDLFGHNREKIIQLGKDFADEIDAFFISCSAKSADNIDNVENHIETETKRLVNEEVNNKKNLNDKKNID